MRIFVGVRKRKEGQTASGHASFASLCSCPRHYEESPAKECEPTHEELKVGLGFLVLVFLCIFGLSWAALKVCPKRFSQHRRAAAQAYLEAVAKHRSATPTEEDELKTSERLFRLKEAGAAVGSQL